MNANIGQWLFSTLFAHESRALRKPHQGEVGYQPVMGVFNPDQGAVPDLATNAAAFQARYNFSVPLSDLAGSEIGEGRVPDRTEIQARVRQPDNPCLLTNNASYVITDVDILDLRYVARSGRPIWEFIESQHIFNGGGTGDDCQQQLQAAHTQITALQQQIATKDAEITRLRGLVPVAVPPDIDQTVAILKGAGTQLEIGPGLKARFARLGRFVDSLKAKKP